VPVPIVAIQLSAFKFGDEVVLQFIRVLDTYEFGADPDEDEPAELVDRGYWEKRTKPDSLAVVEAVKALTPTTKGEARITYNKHHIALGTSGYNFCWFNPRRVASHCHLQIKLGAEKRQAIIDRLEEIGIDASVRGRSSISFNLSTKDITDHPDLIKDIVQTAEEYSHR
jgi:hypothetical protein